MNKYIPYGRHEINNEDIDAVVNVLKSDFLTQGKEVEKFEMAVKKKLSVKEAVATNSATSALHIACLALDLKVGDFLWTSPVTFVASANCALYCGAGIDFVDIELRTGLINCDKLEEKLKAAEGSNNLPKILMVVHLAGASCDMKRIHELSKKYGFGVIEDASHALGGKYKNKYIGNCEYSNICIFSFHPVKIITSGEGGMATTQDRRIAEKMRMLRSHGIYKSRNAKEIQEKGLWHYEQIMLGYNYRMNDIEAALGQSQLKRLDQYVEKRQKVRSFYEENLKGCKYKLTKIPKECKSALHLVVIQLPEEMQHAYKQIFARLRLKGIGVQLHYIPVHLHPYYKDLGFKSGDYPEAESYAQRSISIPIYPTLKASDLEVTVKILCSEIY
ncbi:UDP-4-amino-4,6-dideoxy-N-acetyl-beta-L-altrosamine transaminase [Prochlorococcus marinus]|uniref:UDP-4-amino-4, 6-dideoxy-N-acetyl-beta-L-altrosamine transaminase n=1 Tax=Prochlorococcus marinus TaxID=1219 RepID=UPI0007B378EC|nr:UDP-4-amino-4,6-dideoxy-N-acetyl-beta-L-altrosamine transaminase [Prochlorococcus marinus]KZR73709.1 UDP-4-amino-4,6-dideoxy-N-acetyl-beta-L-altrosamine transaminase [Prochlorococcus marinus str. MIT 1320]